MRQFILAGAGVLLAVLCFLPSPGHSQTPENPVTLRGDLRWRHETIDVENADQRNQERIRARVNLSARVAEKITLVFGLAGGEVNSPTTTNQTLTGGFSDKQIWIDMAYFDWAINTLHITGGKMRNPFHAVGRTQLIWDSDVNPEGLGFTYTHALFGSELFANGSVLWVEERAAAEDSHMAGGQVGVALGAGVTSLRIGAGLYDYINARDFPAFFDSTRSFGNSTDTLGHYQYGFRIVELFGELGFPRVFAAPALYFEYAVNAADDVEDNRGWQVGASLGRLGKPGSWALRYFYQYLEQNAVVGAFSNSDFAGGGTNNKGHAFGVDYQVTGQILAALNYSIAQRGIEDGLDFHRFQADMNFRF